jgi:hypothetical protein
MTYPHLLFLLEVAEGLIKLPFNGVSHTQCLELIDPHAIVVDKGTIGTCSAAVQEASI